MIKQEYYTLYNGVQIPKVGFGTWQTPNEQAYEAVIHALNAGYRHIDTAVVYENETGVGKAIKDSSIVKARLLPARKLQSCVVMLSRMELLKGNGAFGAFQGSGVKELLPVDLYTKSDLGSGTKGCLTEIPCVDVGVQNSVAE